MPTIRPSSDLRNHYNEISDWCHSYPDAVFITKNGKGDLVVMSIEMYEHLTGKFELYKLLDEGFKAAERRETKPLRDVVKELERELAE